MATRGIYVDERAQAIVLAEVATSVFVARGVIVDICDRFQANEGRLLAVGPEPQGLLRGSNGSGLAAMLMHNDLGLFAICAEAGFDEVHLCLHHGEIILRAALQDKAGAERSQVRDAGYIKEDILRKYVGQTGENLF
jgi:hypothetical protein